MRQRVRILAIASAALFLPVVFALPNVTRAGDYIRVSPDLDIYFQEAGSGPPMVIIPGWTGTSAMFPDQLSYFSKRYRVISYDPRSQGRSTRTLDNNNYQQHGADLRNFLTALHLNGIVLVGHSAGCKDAYAYFRAIGTESIKAFISVDSSAKDIVGVAPVSWTPDSCAGR